MEEMEPSKPLEEDRLSAFKFCDEFFVHEECYHLDCNRREVLRPGVFIFSLDGVGIDIFVFMMEVSKSGRTCIAS